MDHGQGIRVISLHVIRDGIQPLVIVPFPNPTGTAVLVLLCLLSSIEALVCDCGLDFRKVR